MSKILIISIIMVLVAAGIYLEIKRGNRLEATASNLGMAFKSGVQKAPETLLALNFDLLEQGDQSIHNLMQGQYKLWPVGVFDYSYDARISGEGFGQLPSDDDHMGIETRSQSVVWLKSTTRFPQFDISPSKGHMRAVAGRFGFSRLSLEVDPEFEKSTVLLVKDQVAGRALFNDPVRKLLLHSGFVIESRGYDLLFYRFSERLKAKEIEGLLLEVTAIVAALEKSVK